MTEIVHIGQHPKIRARMPKKLHPCWYILSLSSISMLVALVLTYPIWLPHLYKYLNLSQQPQIADVIVVLGGSDGHREAFAVDLYDQGFAPQILASGHAGSMSSGLNIIAKSDVPKDALSINDQATSTYDEAQQVLEILIQMNAHSALIVTDRYHTHRALATYRHVFQGHNIELTIVSPEDGILAESWWQSKWSNQIALEFLKMPYYWAVYGIWPG
jgi:uncharacterized SAM-binding protein YcdF (DUF218 family)